MKTIKKVSVIIVNYKVEEHLINCLKSLYKSKFSDFEVIVVDNSPNTTLQTLFSKKHPELIYLPNKDNVGFARACNQATKIAKGEFLFFLNPDTEIDDSSMQTLVNFLQDNLSAGIASPLLYHPDGKIFVQQGAKKLTPLRAIFATSFIHRIFPNNLVAKDYWNSKWDKKSNLEVDHVPGTAFMIRRNLFEKIKGFDENYFLFFEEFDLARKVKKLHYSLFMIAKTKVIHYWGESAKKNQESKQIFQTSQKYYFKKYYGNFLGNLITTFLVFDKYFLLLLLSFALGIFVRLYSINELFMFIGDFGWFYLSSFDFLTKGIFPLVSIPSSVTWLHQGPLATYLMIFALKIGNLNPVSPALMFSIMDILTIWFVYKLGTYFKDYKLGSVAALLYASSPLVIMSARMPYHTAPIPFFACLVFLLLYKSLKQKKFLFLLFFCFGLLLQLELSNAVILVALSIALYLKRQELLLKYHDFLLSFLGFIFGILPFIIYDITHKFTQTLGFPLWILNRIRLFLGITSSGNSTTHQLPNALFIIWDHLCRIVFPKSQLIVLVLLCSALIFFIQKSNRDFTKLPFILWLIVPLFSFMIHAAPGDAYFPLLFPVIIIMVSAGLYSLLSYLPQVILFILLIAFYNTSLVIRNDYFLNTQQGYHLMPPFNINSGPSFSEIEKMTQAIAKDAGGITIWLKAAGYQGTVKTGADHFKYLLLKDGIRLDERAKVFYTVYDVKSEVPKYNHKVYESEYYVVTKSVPVVK